MSPVIGWRIIAMGLNSRSQLEHSAVPPLQAGVPGPPEQAHVSPVSVYISWQSMEEPAVKAQAIHRLALRQAC